VFGLAIIAMILYAPEGLLPRLRDAWRRRNGGGADDAADAQRRTVDLPAAASAERPPIGEQIVLKVNDLSRAHTGSWR
jgi:hypothetical protein